MQTAHYLVALAAGYLLGSIPFGLIITQLAARRTSAPSGSGSIGATNVLRNRPHGARGATLIADVLKGTAQCWVASWWCGQDFGQELGQELGQDCGLLAGLGAFLGHLFRVC